MKQREFVERTEKIKKRLYNTAFLYLGSEAFALDALDESIYKALKNIKSLREEAFFETWITRILINECKKELKRRQKFSDEEMSEEIAVEEFDNLPLKEAIAKLPSDLKTVIILRFFTGYTLRETAECMEIPQGTAVTWQRKALKLLRLELEVDDE